MKSGDSLVKRLSQFFEVNLFGAGGEDAGQEHGFSGVAEEGNLSGTQRGRGLLDHFGKGLCGFDQQRRGDGALPNGNHDIGAAAAVAGVSC